MGAPVVFPSKIPERMWAWSGSRLGVVRPLCPGLRRSSSDWISVEVKAGILSALPDFSLT